MSLEKVKANLTFLHYPTDRDMEDILYAVTMFIAAIPWLLVLL